MNKSAILLSLALLCGFSKREAQAEVFGLADLDVLIISTAAMNVTVPSPSVAANGDFNGDGYNDVAVTEWSNDDTGVRLVFGGNLLKTSQLSNVASIKIKGIVLDSYKFISITDLNNDGKDDLFVGEYSVYNNDHGYVIFGSSAPPAHYDVRTIQPNEGIILNSSQKFSIGNIKGDFTGDGIDDLFMYENLGVTSSFLFSGRKYFANPTYQLDQGAAIKLTNCPAPFPRGKTTGGDINGDGITDIVSTIPVYPSCWAIILGTTTFQSPWDVQQKANRKIFAWGDYSRAGYLIDWTGDGYSELFVSNAFDKKSYLLDGKKLIDGPTQVYLTTDLQIYSIATVDGMPEARNLFLPSFYSGDFDGDGKTDFFFLVDNRLKAYLSSDLSGETGTLTPSFEYMTPLDASLGDVNGDGKDDLVVMPQGGPDGSVGIIYGYRPLKNPTIRLRAGSHPPKAIVEFFVEGDPAEMLVTGDFIDNFRGKWVPYQTSLPLTLTQTEGEKTVSVIFRNSFGRESSPAQTTWTLTPGAPAIEIVNNVIGPGATSVRMDGHLTNAAHVRATVHDQTGGLIAEITNTDLAAGIWPLEWDGTNESGRPVLSGVYYMVIEIDGRAEKRKILVQR
ncbi:MAG: VCBS repeat-containing protein [Elusimicrobia bacterium]|nr:VCBS repeat-containing protein [Elusimicrobiota bacterium]